jgi:restriction system protein
MKLWERVIFRSGRYRRELARAEKRFAEAQNAFRAAEDRRIKRLYKMQAHHAESVRQRLIEAEKDYRTAYPNWIERLSMMQTDHSARVRQRCTALDGLERGFAAGDASAIATYFSMVLLRSPYPEEFTKKFEVSYFPNVKGLIVDYDLPSPGVRTSNEYLDHQVRTIYEDVANSITLRTIGEVIAADCSSHVAIVIFNGFVPRAVPATGPHTRRCLISVQVAKEDFSNLDLTRIDKASCLQYFGAASGIARHNARAAAAPTVNGRPEPDNQCGLLINFVEERRLEGSRDIYQFRDHGQFGSYPSHDDYGDESAP